jgi:hypothetical protein
VISCEAGIFKSYADSQLLLPPKCPECKERLRPLNYRQRCCQNYSCKKVRRLAQQKAYDQGRRGIETQEVEEVYV